MTNRKPNDKAHAAGMVSRAFWLPREQDRALRLVAQRNQRTLSGELRLVVEKHLAENPIELDEAA